MLPKNESSQQKVVFLTIDDGTNKTPEEAQLLKANGIKSLVLLAHAFISPTQRSSTASPWTAARRRTTPSADCG